MRVKPYPYWIWGSKGTLCETVDFHVSKHVSLFESQMVLEIVRHHTVTGFNTESLRRHISEIYLFGGLCKNPHTAQTVAKSRNPFSLGHGWYPPSETVSALGRVWEQ
jgi:hypothetical protein